MLIKKLCVAITFFYNRERLPYLGITTSNLDKIAEKTIVYIITNVNDFHMHQSIYNSINKSIHANVLVPSMIGHPYLLPWFHFDAFRNVFLNDPDVTHFMYLEDDLLIKPHNIEYWMNSREVLRPNNLIPSFLRFEVKSGTREKYSTDCLEKSRLDLLPRVLYSDSELYVNLPKPYQGMYLLDRELMEEHLNGPTCNPDFGMWPIREKAAQGLTFSRVQKGCYSRNFIKVNTHSNKIHECALIHHIPNNYCNDPNSPFGKIKIEELVY